MALNKLWYKLWISISVVFNLSKTWYIAHPYTGNIKKNMKLCIERCNKLLDLGYIIFSPITQSHQFDIKKKRKPAFWYMQDLRLLELFDGIILMPGWQYSLGCNMEVTKAKALGKTIKCYEEIINENKRHD